MITFYGMKLERWLADINRVLTETKAAEDILIIVIFRENIK